MSVETTTGTKSLKMVTCGRCKARVFIPANLEPFATIPCTKCEHPLMVPVMLRNFEVRTVIAVSGMATVYTAYDTKLDRDVALKMVRRDMASDPEIMKAFYREARATAALNHTNIIHTYSFDEFNGQPYLVMELADQGSLDGRMEANGRVSELEVLDVAIKIADALAKALKHNLLHRDIKPGNILFNKENEPKLIDFGLARAAEVDSTWEEHIWGTVYYVAPERIERKPDDFHSDMYSFGGTFYHALTGHVPFDGTVDEIVRAHVYTPLTPPNLVAPDITELTSNVLVQAMAKNPADRFETYDDLRMALELARTRLLCQQQEVSQGREPGGATRSWWKR